jgi:hypothetical protein
VVSRLPLTRRKRQRAAIVAAFVELDTGHGNGSISTVCVSAAPTISVTPPAPTGAGTGIRTV